MMANMMKANVEVVHCSTYRGLKEDEKSNQAHISLRKEFNNRIKERFGQDISPEKFPDVDLENRPLYDMYEYDTTDAEGVLAVKNEGNETPIMATGFDHEVPTPEVNANYVNDSVMFSYNYLPSSIGIISRKHD